MKTKKILALALCAVMLVCISVGATVAYLTAGTGVVTNTFTVGNVQIDLDETKTTEYGVIDATATAPVKANEYKLIPNHTYVKDPTVHVKATSEPCYVFVKVVNGIDAIEAETETGVENGYVDIAAQMTANGWVALADEEGVFYYNKTDKNAEGKAGVVDARAALVDLVVFENFKIANNANVSGYVTATNASATITIDAYAVQADGFASAAAAWTAAKATWEN